VYKYSYFLTFLLTMARPLLHLDSTVYISRGHFATARRHEKVKGRDGWLVGWLEFNGPFTQKWRYGALRGREERGAKERDRGKKKGSCTHRKMKSRRQYIVRFTHVNNGIRAVGVHDDQLRL